MGKDFTLGTPVCVPQRLRAANKTSGAVSAKMEPHQQRPSFLDSLQTPGLSLSLPQRPGRSRVSFAMVIPTARWRFPARPAPGCPAAAPRGRSREGPAAANRDKTGQIGTKRGKKGQTGAVSSLVPALCQPGFSLRIAGHRWALPLLPLCGVMGGFSVTLWLPPVLLGRSGTFLVSHPCLLPLLLDVRHRRGEEELSVLGKQQGAEGLFGLCCASGSSGK